MHVHSPQVDQDLVVSLVWFHMDMQFCIYTLAMRLLHTTCSSSLRVGLYRVRKRSSMNLYLCVWMWL